ncbi:MAG: hypothetical protein FWE67_09900 [Planctomycetaceae bacterium]|nr:hypothetical protein [Planctomycetaceae bacterium]
MSNRPFTPLIPPGVPIPDPPEYEWLRKFIAGFFGVVLLLIIVFISFDIFIDVSEHLPGLGNKAPVTPQEQTENDIIKETVENVKSVLEQTVLISPVKQCRIKCRKDGVAVVPFLCKWDTERGKREKEPPVTLRLFTDGMPVEWDAQFGKTVFFAAVELPPGHHILSTAVHDIDVFVEDGDFIMDKKDDDDETLLKRQLAQTAGYTGLPQFQYHTGVDDIARCGECHQDNAAGDIPVGKNRFAPIGEWKGGQSCIDCHTELKINFRAAHKRPLDVYNDCRKCHSVHGAVHPFLFRDSREVLCIQCHDQRIEKE